MNACALEFPDDSFEVVLDKGTMDSVLCGEGSTANVAKMCSEVSRCAPLRLRAGRLALHAHAAASRSVCAPLRDRVLKPNGVYIVISYGIPDNRLTYLENEEYGWKVTVHTVRTSCAPCSCARVHPAADVWASTSQAHCQRGSSAGHEGFVQCALRVRVREAVRVVACACNC